MHSKVQYSSVVIKKGLFRGIEKSIQQDKAFPFAFVKRSPASNWLLKRIENTLTIQQQHCPCHQDLTLFFVLCLFFPKQSFSPVNNMRIHNTEYHGQVHKAVKQGPHWKESMPKPQKMPQQATLLLSKQKHGINLSINLYTLSKTKHNNLSRTKVLHLWACLYVFLLYFYFTCHALLPK